MTTTLIVAPHGVDEILGCGGLIAASAAAGGTVETLILFGDGNGLDATRRLASLAAARELGSRPPRHAGFPENRSDTVAVLDIVTVIERTIADTSASEIYVPHRDHLNIDHQAAFNATMIAARPVPRSPIRSILSYEILSSSNWSAPSAEGFQPTRFVDISSKLERKLGALAHYHADMRPPPHSRSYDGVRALARHRGLTVGFEAAEAFGVIRQLVPATAS